MRKYIYPAEFIEAKDAARIELAIDLGFDIKIHEIIRLDAIWVPTIYTVNKDMKSAYCAKKFVENRLSTALKIRVHSIRREHDLFFGDVLYKSKDKKKFRSIKQDLIRSGFGEVAHAC